MRMRALMYAPRTSRSVGLDAGAPEMNDKERRRARIRAATRTSTTRRLYRVLAPEDKICILLAIQKEIIGRSSPTTLSLTTSEFAHTNTARGTVRVMGRRMLSAWRTGKKEMYNAEVGREMTEAAWSIPPLLTPGFERY